MTPNPLAPRRRPLRSTAVLLLALALVASACSSGGGGAQGDAGQAAAPTIAPVPADDLLIPAEDVTTPTLPLPEGFEPPDTRSARLTPVVGEPAPPPDPEANLVPVRGGDAELRVTVRGPDGPVEGAMVRFERFVGAWKGWEDVPADGDGVALLDEARGGRYRIRAWSRPDMATDEAQLVFVRADEEVDLAVRVERHDREILQGRLTVPEWLVGDIAPLEVLFVREEVGDDGIVRGLPLVAPVTVSPIAGAAVVDEATVVTDGDGRAVLNVECLVSGIHQTFVASGLHLVGVELPECRPRPLDDPLPDDDDDEDQPTDEIDDPQDPTAPTTSVPGATTTTTRAPTEIEVGRRFTPPFAGPLGAGVYQPEPEDGRDPDTCRVTYRTASGGRWLLQQRSGTLLVGVAARDIQPAPGTTACTYRRLS